MGPYIPLLPPRSPNVYTIGWLGALPDCERDPALKMLDNHHERPTNDDWLKSNDITHYSYGDLNEHNIVVACMPFNTPG